MTFDNIWTPWRGEYVSAPQEPGCVFCRSLEDCDNPEKLVVAIGEQAFIILNLFPYTSGHLMVVPKRHIAGMDELKEGEWAEMGKLLTAAQEALKSLYNPHGFNVGINLGKAAGAGIADHLHMHLVPRWNGDTNFLPVMTDVRVIPHHMEKIYADLKGRISL